MMARKVSGMVLSSAGKGAAWRSLLKCLARFKGVHKLRHKNGGLCRLLKKNPDDWIDYQIDPRPHHDFRYALHTAKLAKLGWQMRSDIEAQLAQTVCWYQEHQTWWRQRKAAAENIYR